MAVWNETEHKLNFHFIAKHVCDYTVLYTGTSWLIIIIVVLFVEFCSIGNDFVNVHNFPPLYVYMHALMNHGIMEQKKIKRIS